MKKMTTLFCKDPNDLGRVINKINLENEWVYKDAIPTQKFDGTAAAIDTNGYIYKRYDVKEGREVPKNAIPCQEADKITGHWPHWVKCDRANPADKYFFEAFDREDFEIRHGTYELCGEKINKNPEKIEGHKLLRHGSIILDIYDFSFDAVKNFLSDSLNDIEGIVFHSFAGEEMCKIRKSDFGVKRI
jgi:hypothetical protein